MVVILGIEAALVALSIVVGVLLNRAGVPIHADAAPLFGTWQPHLGPGTPAALAVAALVVWHGPAWARRASWGRLLLAGYLGAVAWTLSLALVDGWSGGLATRLTARAEYLTEVPRVTDIPAMLDGFTDGIVYSGPESWTTHVAGHPPGALLVFVWLDRIGLGGGGPAALLCVLVGATVAVSVPVTLRALGEEDAARTVVPFLVLFPGAVWVGVSADGLFAGVLAAGLALLAVGGRWAAPAGGVLLGFSLYLSYGLVLAGLLALAVIGLRWRTLVAGLPGVCVVVAAFTVAGFWWLDGYHLVVQRYYQGWGSERPYWYWVWANLAALVLSAGPALGPALRNATKLSAAAALAIVVADLSGLSKSEVERIWLPFAVWLLVAAEGRGWLAAQAATALAVNHLLWTNW